MAVIDVEVKAAETAEVSSGDGEVGTDEVVATTEVSLVRVTEVEVSEVVNADRDTVSKLNAVGVIEEGKGGEVEIKVEVDCSTFEVATS